MDEFDVLVIGGSLSGAISAFLLGINGKRVCIFDPQTFPRRKACGEGLSAIGANYLKQLNLWSSELETSAQPFFGYKMINEAGDVYSLRSENTIQGYGISRVLLDSHVLSVATSHPNVTKEAETVVAIRKKEATWVLKTQSQKVVTAPKLIVASSQTSSKLLSDIVYQEENLARYGLAIWCEGEWKIKKPTEITIFNKPEGQYIVTPVGPKSVNISMLLYSGFRITKNEAINKAVTLVRSMGFCCITISEPFGASAVHSARIKNNDYNYYLVGDGIERFDPISGMGMTHAIYSAELAAKSILSGDSSAKDYYKSRERGARILRLITKLSYSLNVERNKALQEIVKRSPHLSYLIQFWLKGIFPSSEFNLNKKKGEGYENYKIATC